MSQDALFISAIAIVFIIMASLAMFSRFHVNHLIRNQREAEARNK